MEETGRQTLTEMRHLVGILREDEEEERQPLPRLERLPALVDEARAGGLTVELAVEGYPGGAAGRAGACCVPPRAGGAHQRAQARAGVAHGQVRLAYEPDRQQIEVTDEGGSHGVAGPREPGTPQTPGTA